MPTPPSRSSIISSSTFSPRAYNAREFHVIDNPGSTADIARLTGIISSDSAVNMGNLSDVLKTGDGTLELDGANTYLGGTIVAEGTLLAGNDHALGDDTGSYVILGNRGGSPNASLLTTSAVNINRTITMQSGRQWRRSRSAAATPRPPPTPARSS